MPILFLEILITLAVIVLTVGFFVSAYVLYIVTNKFFKITSSNYKVSLVISLLLILGSLVIGAISYLISNLVNIALLLDLLSIVAGFVIFHLLLKKYFQTGVKKNLLIYIVYSILSVIVTVVISLVIIFPVRAYIMEPFYVSSASMDPSLVDSDYIILNKFDKNIQRGDIVVFKYPKDLNQYFIKRVVALPGEKISFIDGNVMINGQVLVESNYLSPDIATIPLDISEYELGAAEYFVLGDKRDASLDSRRFGPVNKNLITGKYWFTGFKANQLSFINN